MNNGNGAAINGSNQAGGAIADNTSVCPSNKEIEVEFDQLRSELEATKRLLKEKTVEVEKSTQLFTMFDQQIREM